METRLVIAYSLIAFMVAAAVLLGMRWRAKKKARDKTYRL